jgi:hypothetical protein
MNYLRILFLSALFVCCSEDKQPEAKPASKGKLNEFIEPGSFPKYNSAMEAFVPKGDTINGYDVSDEIKLLSKPGEPEHILILIEDDGSAKQLRAETKGMVIYGIFGAFAYTNINEITITSIPERKGKYLEKYRLTATASRDKAKNILKKYVHTETFQDLFYFETRHGFWNRTQKFDSLIITYSDSVFADLKR